MAEHEYQDIMGFGVQCVDCGAFAETQEQVVHYEGCEPGSSKKWSDYYNQTPEDMAKEQEDDRIYGEYLDGHSQD